MAIVDARPKHGRNVHVTTEKAHHIIVGISENLSFGDIVLKECLNPYYVIILRENIALCREGI